MMRAKSLVGVYAFPTAHVRVTCTYSNSSAIAPYRGNGRPEAIYVLAALFLAGVAAAAGFVVGRETAPEGGGSAPATAAATDPGAEVFADAGCGSCHAFGPAGSSGAIGPSLDATRLDEAGIAQVVANGRRAMRSST